MNKELEALKEIKEKYKDDNGLQRRLSVIETAIKEYELMKQVKIIVADKDISAEDLEKHINQRMFVGNLEQCEIKPLFDEETQKKLKALEIIKEKGEINIYEPNMFHDAMIEIILKIRSSKDNEWFDLLKEVLL